MSVAGGVATVGAGARLGDLYDALTKHELTIPAGCGPSVGIAGLTLGGGLGILGRKHGLTCDHLLSAQVVLADGRVVECDEHHHEALFWALRGAGGGQFGVVTSLVFRTLAEPAATSFRLRWPHTHAAAVIDAWQAWAPGGAYNRVRHDATAFVHRSERFSLKHVAIVDTGASPTGQPAAQHWLRQSWASVQP